MQPHHQFLATLLEGAKGYRIGTPLWPYALCVLEGEQLSGIRRDTRLREGITC